MIISLIAAMSENGVIGFRNRIPWDVPEDRRRFRELTMRHVLIMGRKTYESIGFPLPGRRTIVLTRNIQWDQRGCAVAHDLEQALSMCDGEDEVFIAGGAEVFREAMPLAHRIYLTMIDGEYEGDVFFPDIGSGFNVVKRERLGKDSAATLLVFVR